MSILRLSQGAILALAFTACGSINPAYQADVDRRIASLHPGSQAFAASDALEPMPLAVGQWIELKPIDDKQRPSLMKYKVVGQEGSAFWIETWSETYKGKSELRMLVDFGDRKNPETVSIKGLRTRTNDGAVQDYPENMLGIFKSMWKPVVSSMIISWADLPREDATVPAGHFVGCYKRRANVKWGWYEATSDGWMHPAVPINGLVRSVNVDKGGSVELIGFGTEGASSTF
jgi:hypothetical protein